MLLPCQSTLIYDNWSDEVFLIFFIPNKLCLFVLSEVKTEEGKIVCNLSNRDKKNTHTFFAHFHRENVFTFTCVCLLFVFLFFNAKNVNFQWRARRRMRNITNSYVHTRHHMTANNDDDMTITTMWRKKLSVAKI